MTTDDDAGLVLSVAPTVDGVFFTRPGPFPRGKHGLTRDDVLAMQRERLMIASTELLAGRGYAGVRVRQVCERAGMSLSAFYECFDSREDVIHAAYDRFIDVLLRRLLAVPGQDTTWEAYVEDVMTAYFGALQVDLVVARAFQVEMDAMGWAARDRRRESLGILAEILRQKHVEWDPAASERIPAPVYLTAVYGVRQLASDALDRVPGSPDEDDEAVRSSIERVRLDAIGWVTLLFASPADP
ncbi:hypothetical protein ASD11_10170 [Aeromicrobium sp. Root495]|uniref:TetR/AcrR family transcriptional regulator n=1 Tax=Aeromicrobium sp. Root495 TaxID=1736550 RepID=UPI0006F42071|nr:TetR/AcrR family transcriptional regulator [Aeromicrobium sp. Root495]KQY59874.1 hypothetical protein ASD11_10170 [Aeromicrobium sp. Root495]